MRFTQSLPATLAGVLLVFGLAGCGDQLATGLGGDNLEAATDQEAIGLLISEDTEHFGLGSEHEDDQVAVNGSSAKSGASSAPIRSFFFRRIIKSVDVTKDIHIEHPAGEPAVAEVTVMRDLRGIFRLYYDDPDNVYLPGTLDKRLRATATRRAVFKKRDGDRRHRGWRLVEISGVEVVSRPTTKVIQMVEIKSPSVDLVITDPLALVPVRELPVLGAGEEVMITVTTTDETDYVFLHAGQGKDEFRPMGGGVFTGSWTTREQRGRARVAVDVIDQDTLFDDEAPYDSVIWGFVYRIGPTPSDTRPNDTPPSDTPPRTDGGDTVAASDTP